MLGLALADPYTKRIGLYDLTITAPESTRQGQIVIFKSLPDQQDVIMRYDKTSLRAAEVQLNEQTNQIYLSGGFQSKYLNNVISGETFSYNLDTEDIAGNKIIISTEDFYSYSEQLYFNGKKIELSDATLGLEVISFSMKSRQLDLYPGWMVFYDTTFRWRDIPFWHIPRYIVDKRRNAFELPGSFPEFGRSFFAGEYGRFNNHYYLNESFYGNLYFGYAELKGWGYGMQNIFRLSERGQMTYINENWQWFPTQEVISFGYSFLDIPNDENHKMTFNDLLRYNEELKEAYANSLRISHTVNEEANSDIINKDIELEYRANFDLPGDWFNIHTINTYTSIQELTTEREGASLKSYTELSRGIEIPYLTTIRPGLGYDTVKYSVHPYNWHRIFSFISASKRFWIFRWYARAYDYLNERGSSPFSYDEPYAIGDNVRTTSTISLWNMTLGQTVRYIIYDGHIHRMLYFLEYTSRPWTIRIEHNYTDNSWWAGVSACF